LFGNGKTALKASMGRHVEAESTRIFNRNNTYSIRTTWGTPTDILVARLFKFGAQTSL
jgi:hypothetical protein